MNGFPSVEDIMTDKRGHRFMYWQFHIALDQLAQKSSAIIRPIVESGTKPTPATIDEFKKLYQSVLDVFITDYSGWSTIHTISEKAPVRNLDDLERMLKEMKVSTPPNGAESPIFRHTVATDLFVELSRIHFITTYSSLMSEVAQLRVVPKDPSQFKLLWSPATHSSYFTDVPEGTGAIMTFKQSQVMFLLLKLSEKINFLPIDAVDEVKRIVDLLCTRNSTFFCERMKPDILDSMTTPTGEPTRDYMTFCTIYFHAIMRRIRLFDTCHRVRLSGACPFPQIALQYFVEREIRVSSDYFDEEYPKACEEGYSFPGDLEWFKYRYPDIPPQTGPLLDCFRKDLAKSYYTTHRMSQDVVLSAAQLATHSGHISRIFIFNLFDHYLRIQFGANWKDAVLIKNSALDSVANQKKLFSKRSAPFLVQVFSRYWVYCDKKVYMTDDIYEAISYWMYLLKTHYGGKLYGVDLNGLISRIWQK